jgi:hypothetical protein
MSKVEGCTKEFVLLPRRRHAHLKPHRLLHEFPAGNSHGRVGTGAIVFQGA